MLDQGRQRKIEKTKDGRQNLKQVQVYNASFYLMGIKLEW